MKKVFVADNNFGCLLMLHTWFKNRGYYVRTFSSSQPLFEALDEFLPDVIMLDENLQGNGKEIGRQIKSLYGEHISIILSSGNSKNCKDADDFVVDGVLQKPFAMQQISQIINACMN